MAMGPFVPPGGAAGFVQMTPASRLALTRGSNGAARPAMRRRSRKKSTTRRAARAKTKGRKMKFGSPAWQKKYKVGKFRKKGR